MLELAPHSISSSLWNCKFNQATTYEGAIEQLKSENFDLVILDIMGVRGFDLLERAVLKKIPVAMLTAHALTPEALKRSMEMGARAYLPKEKLGQIVPFLEDVLTYEYLPGWKRLLMKLEKTFIIQWGEYWKKSDETFWKEFEEKTKHKIVW